MKIYKLGDEIPEERRGRNAESEAGGSATMESEGLKITDLKQGVKNPNRVNVFVNGKYELSLDVAQVVDMGVKVGLTVSAERLGELKRASEFGKQYQRALEWVLMQPRSERELRDYLKRRERLAVAKERQRGWRAERDDEDGAGSGRWVKKGGGAGGSDARLKPARERGELKYDFSDLIVQRLTERGYVDDRKFAEYYVENRFVKKGVSRKRLAMELAKKGVEKETIAEVLGGRNDEDEIRKIIARKRARYDDEKLVAYLCRQGFSYELVKSIVGEVSSE